VVAHADLAAFELRGEASRGRCVIGSGMG
jgi:hypothetical protein